MPSDDPSREALPPSGPQLPQSEQRQLGPADDELADIPFVVPVEEAKTDSTPFAEVVEPDAPSAIPFAQLVEPASAHIAIPLVQPASPETVATVLPTPKPPHPGFWWSALWCLVFFMVGQGAGVVVLGGAVLGQLVVAELKTSAQKTQTKEVQQSPGIEKLMRPALAPATLVQVLVSAAFAWLIIRLIVGRDWRRRLALRRPSIAQVLLALLGLPGLTYLSDAVYVFSKEVLRLPTLNYQSEMMQMVAQWPWWFAVLAVGLGPAVAEELWCRGFLGRGLLGRYGAVVGILLTAFFFGIMHLDPPHVVATMVMGICLHFAYLMTRSLFVPMLLHFLNNSLAVVSVSYSQTEIASEKAEEVPVEVYLGAAVLVAAVGWALYRSRTRFVASIDGAQSAWEPPYPGVEYPPPEIPTRVVRPWPGLLAAGLVVVALVVLGILVYPPEWLPPFRF